MHVQIIRKNIVNTEHRAVNETEKLSKEEQHKACFHKNRITQLYQDYAHELTMAVRKTFGDGPPDPLDVTQQAFEKLMLRGGIRCS